MVVLLKNAVPWVSFILMGSCGLFGFKYKGERENNSSNILEGGSPEKKRDVGGGID